MFSRQFSSRLPRTMKFVIFACLLVVALARPDSYERNSKFIPIIRDDRQQVPDAYSFDVETGDGIVRSESGSLLTGVEYTPLGQQGSVSFTHPNGEEFYLKFVADENGYQPESPHLPVAPAFPHPIPQFVLDQIEKARQEDAGEIRSPSQSYNK